MARILFIIPFSNFFPPRGGGMLRCFHTLRELSREHEVHAVSLQSATELHEEQAGYRIPDHIKVYSPDQFRAPRSSFDLLPSRIGNALKFRWHSRSWQGPASSVFLQLQPLVQEVLARVDVEVAIFTTMLSLPLALLVKRLRPKALRIANLENVESLLIEQEMNLSFNQANEQARRSLQIGYRAVHRMEAGLARHVDAFFACSDDDLQILNRLNKRSLPGFEIPNGVDTNTRCLDARDDKHASMDILFCGTLGYEPNRTGLLWFHSEVWPRLLALHKNIRLVVIGWGGSKADFVALVNDDSVDFIGAVETVDDYYRRCGVVIVPLHQGSGTRLKILEAMSFGNPVVSTRIGAEGLKVLDGEHLFIAVDPDSFIRALERLLTDARLFDDMRQKARLLVEERYDWRTIGRSMNHAIQSLLPKSFPESIAAGDQ